MNFFNQTSSAKSQFERSLADVIATFQTLPPFRSCLEEAAELVATALKSGHKLMLCGNGGSASDTAHIANEFTCRFCDDRRPYPAMSFATDGGLLSAIGNDYHFDDLFARQVLAFGKKGDIFIGLSSSGNSRNVLKALQQAKKLGITTIALLGKTGGFTAGVADREIIVPGRVTARIQEAQKFLLHVLCEIVEERLPKEFSETA
ncbi:MAG: SIS domain-containing protein [Chthoniobacterales bacterium]|nr:SIS domain-containing protein [Chthoniobacterales bacterium]